MMSHNTRYSMYRLAGLLVFSAILIFLVSLNLPVAYAASTINVNTTADENGTGASCSLREALTTANTNANFGGCTGAGGGPFTINVPPGTYTLSLGELQIGPNGNINVTVNGTGSAASTVIQATNTGCPSVSTCNNRVFNLDPNLQGNVTVVIQHVTIAHGRTSDAIGGAGIISGCETPGCPNGFDSTTVNDVVFNDNNVLGSSAGAVGGGIQNIGGTLIVQNSTFTNNSAGVFRGGGIYYDAHSPSIGTFTVSNSTFTGNVSNSDNSGGGAIYMTAVAGSTLSITGSTFSGNSAGGTSAGGAAVYKDGGSTLTIDHTTFLNNQVTSTSSTTNLSSGGAIDVNTGIVNVSYSRFVGNTVAVAGHGGGIYTAAGATTTATNNWWGCNGGPNTAGCDTVAGGGTNTFNPWIVLSNTASPNPILVNQATTLTASFLQNSAGSPLTTGNISVLIGLPVSWGSAVRGTLSGAQTTIQANGTATASFTANAAGAGSAGATVDNGAGTASITINKANTTTAITSDTPDPSATGQAVTVNFSVASSTGSSPMAPTGNVTVSDGVISCTGTVAAGQCSIIFTSTGAKSLTATYVGDANFNGSASTPATAHTVNLPTTTTLTLAPNPSLSGQAVMLTATVTSTIGTPTGTVQFYADGATFGPLVTLSSGKAVTSTLTLGIGTHPITATYSGDTNYTGSTSTQVNQVVNPWHLFLPLILR